MDKKTAKTEQLILLAALDAVRQLGVEVTAKAVRGLGKEWDTEITVRVKGQAVTYCLRIERALRPAAVELLVYRQQAWEGKPLLVADYVTPPLADRLRERGVEFIDAAGNAYLNQPPLFIVVKGQRPKIFAPTEPKGRAFQPTGLKVLFALLCRPELANQTYREIAAATGVAHGTVGWVLPELQQLGFIAEIEGTRRLMNAEVLLKQWVEAYIRTLRPKLHLGRYRTETLDWTRTFNGAKYGLLLGGEPAARQRVGNLRPGTVTLYGAKAEPRLILDQRLRQDPQGNVEILERFWPFEGEHSGLAPDVLIYADLLATGDARCFETADLLHERIKDRFVKVQ